MSFDDRQRKVSPLEPLVSVLVPTYNSARLIGRSLDSILAQTYPRLDVHVLDDASTDDTPGVLRAYEDRGVAYHRFSRNAGGYGNMNRGLDVACGDLIAIYHADDLYDPTLVEREVAFLEAHPEAGAVLCMDRWIDEQDRVDGHTRATLPAAFAGGGSFDLGTVLPALMRHKNTFLRFPSFMVRRELFEGLGGFDERFDIAADLDMYLRILRRVRIGILDEELMSYRHFPQQWSAVYARYRTQPERYFDVIDHHLAAPEVASHVDRRSRRAYRFHRMDDETARAVNALILRDHRLAGELLRASRWWRVAGAGPRRAAARTLVLRVLLWLRLRHIGPRERIGRVLFGIQYGKPRGRPASATRVAARETPEVALFVEPFSAHFHGDALFDGRSALSRDGVHLPFAGLREAIAAEGIPVHTADVLRRGELVARRNLYVALGAASEELLARDDVFPSAFFLWEPPVVDPGPWRRLPELAERFRRVFTWTDRTALRPYLPDGANVHPFRFPQAHDRVFPELFDREDRGFLVLLASDRRPRSAAGELYGERVRAIEFFARHGEIDLYGPGWGDRSRLSATDRAVRRAYRGVVASKHETLSRYRFSICFENMVFPGWITEKIFDCFVTGTVPVYLGAPDIERSVPAECFVDMRRFDGYEALRDHLRSLTDDDVAGYREAARAYLASEAFVPFRAAAFAALVRGIVDEDALTPAARTIP